MDCDMFGQGWSPVFETFLVCVSILFFEYRVVAMSILWCAWTRFVIEILLSLSSQVLGAVAHQMRNPNPDCPLRPDLAQAYVTDRAAYEQVLFDRCKSN